jgi:hypothetical protein
VVISTLIVATETDGGTQYLFTSFQHVVMATRRDREFFAAEQVALEQSTTLDNRLMLEQRTRP